ncbi:oxidative stress-induced growth inhibitor 2, partial [Mediterranea sp. An20]
LYMTVTAIAGFGKGNGAMEIRHIEKLDLPVQENMNLYNNVYGKGTEEE